MSQNPDPEERPQGFPPQEEEEVREVHPMVNLTGPGQGVPFADFRATTLPADAPEPVEEFVVVPKGSSALEPAPSSESPPTSELQTSESPVLPGSPVLTLPTLPTGLESGLEDLAAEQEDGQPSQSEAS